MFFTNLKIAIRSLRKNRLYTFINLFGLTIGIAACLLIFRMVSYEFSFNKDFANYDRIYRVVSEQHREGDDSKTVCIPIPAMDLMESTVTQFEAFAKVHEAWPTITIADPRGGAPIKKFALEDGTTSFFTTPQFTEMFQWNWLAGNAETALKQPGEIVLTRTWAEKCFDNWEAAMGQVILLDNIIPVTVKGVIADLPTNIDFNFPFLISYETLKANKELFYFNDGWGSCSSNDQVYALLGDKDQEEAANAILAKVGAEEYTDKSTGVQGKVHYVQPLAEMHFDEDLGHSGSHVISKSRLKVLSFIGVLILLMACFNFINLATAQSLLRAKEVGVRKTLGSRRGQLIAQFMSETGIIVLFSVVVGANLALLISPLLKYISDVPDALPFLSDPKVAIFLVSVGFVITLLAGLYPAFKLSSYQPVRALSKEVSNKKMGGAFLNQSLVVLQFAIAQALIIGAIITINQLDFIRSKDLGFDKSLVYSFGMNSDSTSMSKQTALRQKLLQIPEIEIVSFNSDQPLSGNTWKSNVKFHNNPEDEKWNISMKFVDDKYKDTYGLRLVAGEWLTASDTMKQVIVNETAMRKFGINNPADIIGKHIKRGRKKLPIIGVVEDFHTHSFHTEHEPLMMSTLKDYSWNVGVKIRPDNIKSTVTNINKAFDNVLPEQVFQGEFLDENIARFYEGDNRLSATCKGFGLLAILISCLGLFGLATHAAAQRIKEIGIRKVLGASVGSIVALLSKDFIKLVIVALLIAGPLSYYAMNQWLNNFEFRIDIGWGVFLVAGFMAILIAFLTVSWQAIRAAIANPVRSLRSE